LHKYLYVSANPVNMLDPTGHEEVGVIGQLGVAATYEVLAAMAVISATIVCASAGFGFWWIGYCGSDYHFKTIWRGLGSRAGAANFKADYWQGTASRSMSGLLRLTNITCRS